MQRGILFSVGLIIGILIPIAVFFLFVGGNKIKMSSNDASQEDDSLSINNAILPEVVEINPQSFLEMKDTFSKPTIINFWASWCIPCKKEIPLLKEICDKKGYQIIFISGDRNNEEQRVLLKKTMKKIGLEKTYIISKSSLVDIQNKEALESFIKKIGIEDYKGGIPYLLYYSQKGNLKNQFYGFDEKEAFEKYFNECTK